MLFVVLNGDDTRAVIIRAEALSDAKLYAVTLFPDVSNRSKVLVTETGDAGQRVDYELARVNAELVVRQSVWQDTDSKGIWWSAWRRV